MSPSFYMQNNVVEYLLHHDSNRFLINTVQEVICLKMIFLAST